MFQPLLGESTPARRKIAVTGTLAMCHEPARQEKKYGRGDATHTNQFRRDMNILWKSFDLSSNDTKFAMKDRSRAEFSGIFESSFAQA
jgi:hypothetical protein